MTPLLPVVEVFGPTLQGEGAQVGTKTMFVRLAGCDWACAWCDTPYSWRPGDLAAVERLGAETILGRLLAADAACRRVTLSGGNPALHDCAPLVAALRAAGYRVHLETQGSLAPAWLAQVDALTISPKGPSSGMAPDWAGLAATLRAAAGPGPGPLVDLKVVVFDDADLAFALEVRGRHPEVPLTLQVGNRVGVDDTPALLAKLAHLADRVLAEPRWQGVRVLPQLHVLLWGNRRGV